MSFEVELEFRSRLFERLMGRFFGEAVRRMVAAFEGRAHEIYGKPKARRRRRSA